RKLSFLHLQTKVGPVVYLAKAVGVDVDTVVKWLILIFVSVFDPLAVSLVFCLNLIIRLREKYRRNEFKIGAHSLTSPVDHRYSESAASGTSPRRRKRPEVVDGVRPIWWGPEKKRLAAKSKRKTKGKKAS